MGKSIDEKLFDALMRVPHQLRRLLLDTGFEAPEERHPHRAPHERAHHPEMGPHCPGHKPFPAPEPPGRKPLPSFERERILDVISNYEDGVRQKTLTEELKINPSSVSELISKLESDGYVRRTVDPSDKRATLIRLTDLGEARSAELSDERSEKFRAIFNTLSLEEKEQLLVLLEKLTAPRSEENQ